ncbi:hypothetical protein I5Q23_22785 [Serratia marcescens]|nr:hypothetical protein [Serratia marcescens]
MTTLNEQRNYEDTLSAKFDLVYFLGSISWRLLKVVATRAKPGYSYEEYKDEDGFTPETYELWHLAALLGRATACNPMFDKPMLSLLARGVNRLGILVDPDCWSRCFNDAVDHYHAEKLIGRLEDGLPTWHEDN